MAELLPRVKALAVLAKGYDIGFNIDAEEADRLELSLDLLESPPRSIPICRAGTVSASWCRVMASICPLFVIDCFWIVDCPPCRSPHHGAAGEGRLLGCRV